MAEVTGKEPSSPGQGLQQGALAGTGQKFVTVCWFRSNLCKLISGSCTRACKGNSEAGKTSTDLSHRVCRHESEDLAEKQPLAEGTVARPSCRSGSVAVTGTCCVWFGV